MSRVVEQTRGPASGATHWPGSFVLATGLSEGVWSSEWAVDYARGFALTQLVAGLCVDSGVLICTPKAMLQRTVTVLCVYMPLYTQLIH